MVLLVFFHQQDLCTWSLPCLCKQDILQEKWRELVDFPNPTIQTVGQAKKHRWHLPQSYHFKRCSYQGLYLWDQMVHLRSEHDEKSYSEDLSHRTLAREVNLVVIHISLFGIAFSLSISTFPHYHNQFRLHIHFARSALEKKINISCLAS
jgi:hypothetical protein